MIVCLFVFARCCGPERCTRVFLWSCWVCEWFLLTISLRISPVEHLTMRFNPLGFLSLADWGCYSECVCVCSERERAFCWVIRTFFIRTFLVWVTMKDCDPVITAESQLRWKPFCMNHLHQHQHRFKIKECLLCVRCCNTNFIWIHNSSLTWNDCWQMADKTITVFLSKLITYDWYTGRWKTNPNSFLNTQHFFQHRPAFLLCFHIVCEKNACYYLCIYITVC